MIPGPVMTVSYREVKDGTDAKDGRQQEKNDDSGEGRT